MGAPADEPHEQVDRRAEKRAAAARMEQQLTWVDQQIRVAMAKGEFDDLPGAGKPIADLGDEHDPDWWLKRLVQREQVVLLPESVQLRREDAGLDDRVDACGTESEVRRVVEEFNQRVIRARYSLAEGPPLVTMPRDVEEAVQAWAARLEARRARAREAAAAARAVEPPRRRPWRRGLRRGRAGDG